jgi:hypothetical protein
MTIEKSPERGPAARNPLLVHRLSDWLWKIELQKLANELRMPITVCHLRPGTRKWNKIEPPPIFVH